MAVSVCNECRGKISTNVEKCPHCGNKITTDMFDSENICKINGVEFDFTPLIKDIMSDEIYESLEKSCQYIAYLRELTNCAPMGTLYEKIKNGNGKIPKEFNGRTVNEMRKQAEINRATRPKCPTCGSTNIRQIGFGERTLSVNLFGLSSKKFNKTFECNHCGYTW